MANCIVYFVRRESDGAIKIGMTTNLRRRLPDLRRQHGSMTVLGTVEGAANHEKLAHLIFDDSRLAGEFFQPTPALMSFLKQHATPPPQIVERPQSNATTAYRSSKDRRPWIDRYSDPGVAYDRDQFVLDYESWIEQGLVSSRDKPGLVDIIRLFPEKIVFAPQPGMGRNWGWTPLNPRCWTDSNGRRLHM